MYLYNAAPYAGAIAGRLADVEVAVRIEAIRALGRLGAHAAPFAGALVAHVGVLVVGGLYKFANPVYL